jgi:ketosteroid isomerase-like protein
VKISIFLLALCIPALTQTMSKSGSAEDEVMAVEKQWLKAASEGDANALKQVLVENWMATTPGGDIVHRSDFTENGAQSKLPSMNLTSHTVQFFGDTAVLMGQLTPAGQPDAAFNMTAVFQRKTGTWQMIATHLSLRRTSKGGQ